MHETTPTRKRQREDERHERLQYEKRTRLEQTRQGRNAQQVRRDAKNAVRPGEAELHPKLPQRLISRVFCLVCQASTAQSEGEDHSAQVSRCLSLGKTPASPSSLCLFSLLVL